MSARVRQTDCRTGWQVVDERGRIIATVRRWETAQDIARQENGGGDVPYPFPPYADTTVTIPWLHETDDGFTIRDRD